MSKHHTYIVWPIEETGASRHGNRLRLVAPRHTGSAARTTGSVPARPARADEFQEVIVLLWNGLWNGMCLPLFLSLSLSLSLSFSLFFSFTLSLIGPGCQAGCRLKPLKIMYTDTLTHTHTQAHTDTDTQTHTQSHTPPSPPQKTGNSWKITTLIKNVLIRK